MILRWFPWRPLITRIAKTYGFLDPIRLLAQLRAFAHPSEVAEPVELLRAGVLFHARGLVNTKAIQNNLDWLWPFWVERQFNPHDDSFIPRAFSFSHVNLTHRNWTAVGLPGLELYPIVDPRGMVTPIYDGWSLDFVVFDGDQRLLPSKLEAAEQSQAVSDNLRVATSVRDGSLALHSTVELRRIHGVATCVIRIEPKAAAGSSLAVLIRPYNPEGISFIDRIRADGECAIIVNEDDRIDFGRTPARRIFSTYKTGDVTQSLDQPPNGSDPSDVNCPTSMASGAALFTVDERLRNEGLEVRVPLEKESAKGSTVATGGASWQGERQQCGQLSVPDPLISRLYDAALASLILHSPGTVYPGPYTYRRFWYRDAAFIVHALLAAGLEDRARRAIERFPSGQTRQGYFCSQEGEWDSNGEVLWLLDRYTQLTGMPLASSWDPIIEKGAQWILNKRTPPDSGEPHAGLLPAGFSAEHLGPNDHYYWDNFWSVAGLRGSARLLAASRPEVAKSFSASADAYLRTIEQSFSQMPVRVHRGAIAASPHRRMDAGAIGSIVADYPLQIFPAGDPRMLKTVAYLQSDCSYEGAFFQDMIHSGINAYLTLHMAQVLLRAGDQTALDLIDVVAGLASQTGHWPEAIHPRTGGGCMGDGQHVWAAAEWVLMVRSLFVREEGDRLIIGSGIFPRWLEQEEMLAFGPTPTPFGPVSVRIDGRGPELTVSLEAQWRGEPPRVEVAIPGYTAHPSSRPDRDYTLSPMSNR